MISDNNKNRPNSLKRIQSSYVTSEVTSSLNFPRFQSQQLPNSQYPETSTEIVQDSPACSGFISDVESQFETIDFSELDYEEVYPMQMLSTQLSRTQQPHELVTSSLPARSSSSSGTVTEVTQRMSRLNSISAINYSIDHNSNKQLDLNERLENYKKNENYNGCLLNNKNQTEVFPIYNDTIFIGWNKDSGITCNNDSQHPHKLIISSVKLDFETIVKCEATSEYSIQLNGTFLSIADTVLNDGDVLKTIYDQELQFISRFSTRFDKSKFTILDSKILGVGAFGNAKEAIDNETMTRVAVKIIDKTRPRINQEKFLFNTKNEIDILKRLQHPNVINLIGVEETPEYVHIFLPLYGGGNLINYINAQPGRYVEQLSAKYIFWQLVSAVKYLHRASITHRDIKPDNVLLYTATDYPTVVLCDFGFAKENTMPRMTSIKGTWHYAAPEVVMGLIRSKEMSKRSRIEYDHRVDAWSMGVLLFTMLAGKLPFNEGRNCNSFESDQILFRSICTGQYDMARIMPTNIDSEGTDLIQKLLKIDPEERLNMEQVNQHQWILKDLHDMIEVFQHQQDCEIDQGPVVLSQYALVDNNEQSGSLCK